MNYCTGREKHLKRSSWWIDKTAQNNLSHRVLKTIESETKL